MILRAYNRLLRQRLEKFPAVALVGPRQSGKTTLAKSLSEVYFDLEQEQDRLRLDIEWEQLLSAQGLLVLDEAQCWPEIFAKLRGAIDADRKRNGRFLLLGSVSPALMREVSESLAGRVAVVELTPICAAELPGDEQDALWKFGGFPDGGVLQPEDPLYPIWQEAFLNQMAERDLPTWGLPAKPGVTKRLMSLVAAVNGSQLNASQLGKPLGVSYHTVSSYLDFLENAFLIRQLRPFASGNISKRLTKSPRIYWRDSGLLHSLLEWDSATPLLEQPWVGASWEGWVIEQILAAHACAGITVRPFYFRTNDGLECDLILQKEGGLELVEIKLSTSPSIFDFKKLEKIAELVGASRMVLLSRTTSPVAQRDKLSLNLSGYLETLGLEPIKKSSNPKRSGVPSVAELFDKLKESEEPLLRSGDVLEKTLLQRAQWLHEDLTTLKMPDFAILPSREVVDPGSGLVFRLVEYVPGKTDHDLDQAEPDFPKDSRFIDGTAFSRESLARLAQVSEIGHTVIPHLWLGSKELRDRVRAPTQHFDTLNEVWWLSRWQGVIPESVVYEACLLGDEGGLPCVDWRFQVLDGAVTINLEVKNRRGTVASKLMNKGVYFFGNEPSTPFHESSKDEINVLAITAYHRGFISASEEEKIIRRFLNDSEEGRCLDAVALYSLGEGSEEKLYFPEGREVEKKSLILKALRKPQNLEDHARVLSLRYPIRWEDLGSPHMQRDQTAH
jgi:predicted AAA+ superfamily ATPase